MNEALSPFTRNIFHFFPLLRETSPMNTNRSRKAVGSSASQEISRSLLSARVHYWFHKSPSLAPIMRQTNLFLAPILFIEEPF
jgi:hypothetical protein